jgi:hemoglobin-like flavoprotein
LAVPVSNQEISEVLRSFDMIPAEELSLISKRFYIHLFTRAPELRSMFREDLSGQSMKFMSTLKTIVIALKDPDVLHTELKPLGEGHAILGVVAANFEPMGEALIDTFQEFLGPEFTPEMENAWRNAYLEISSEMIECGGISRG